MRSCEGPGPTDVFISRCCQEGLPLTCPPWEFVMGRSGSLRVTSSPTNLRRPWNVMRLPMAGLSHSRPCRCYNPPQIPVNSRAYPAPPLPPPPLPKAFRHGWCRPARRPPPCPSIPRPLRRPGSLPYRTRPIFRSRNDEGGVCGVVEGISTSNLRLPER